MSLLDTTKHPPGGWAHRALEHTRKTPMLVMIVSMIGAWKPTHAHFIPTEPDQFAPRIDKDGQAWLTFVHQRPEGFVAERECLGPIEEVNDNFRRLADALKLDDPDRIAMFDALRAWFAKDDRATSEDQL